MDKKLEGILQIVLALIVIALSFYFSVQLESLRSYGYFGVFVISLVSAATVFLPAPGWAAVIIMTRYLNPIGLGVAAGLGSAMGELTGYVAGDGARDILNDKIKESEKIKEFVKKYDAVAIFLLAFIPNPLFDVAGIVAGAMKIPWWKFLIATALGRVIRFTAVGYIGETAVQFL